VTKVQNGQECPLTAEQRHAFAHIADDAMSKFDYPAR